jgi:hypothetical protein
MLVSIKISKNASDGEANFDTAIWDNRSVYHAATFDYDGARTGQRAVSLGERPYLDPNSTGRREALEKAAAASS